MAKPTKQEVPEALAKQSIPTDVPKDGFYAPKTQKALNNQGFEYGGSVEIRTQHNGESWAEGLDFCGLERALVRVFVPKVFPRRVCTSPCQGASP